MSAAPMDVVILTADRPKALSRCLASIVACEPCPEQPIRLSVLDNSPGGHGDAAAITRQFGAHYLGRQAVQSWRSRLIAAGCEPATVRFALAPGPLAIGAGRNAILLASAGRRVVSLDDDVVWSLLRCRPASTTRPRANRPDPRVFVFPGGGDPILDPCTATLPSSYALLGTTIDAEAAPSRPLMAVGARPLRRVRVAITGLRGHDTLLSPSPLLFLRHESRRHLLASEDVYRRAYMEATNTKFVDTAALIDAPVCVASCMGLDNTTLLPPFLPRGRGEDMLFGHCATWSDPTLARVCVPEIALHDPVEPRRRTRDSIWTETRWSTARLIVQLLASSITADGASVAERLIACGTALERCTSQSLSAFVEASVTAWQEFCLATIRKCQQFVEEYDGAPAFWRHDIERFAARLHQHVGDADTAVPVDSLSVGGGEREWPALREYLLRFAHLLQQWPRMWGVASSNMP